MQSSERGFVYEDGGLRCDGAALDEAFAARFGTPVYVYSAAALRDHYQAMAAAFAPLNGRICYSVKSCSNLSILALLAAEGSHFDVVSGGEVRRVLAAGIPAERIVFAGVGKTDAELAYALEVGIHHFNAEASSEVERLQALASERGMRARVALRLNPDVDPKTHRYITTGKRENKFGLDLDRAGAIFDEAARFPNVDLEGLHVHIGSQVQESGPYVEALTRVLAFADERRAAGAPLSMINMGGGFGISYEDRTGADPARFAAAVGPLLAGRGYELYLEPGRSISANAGLLLTRVIDVKRSGERRFIIVDAGMNDLIRPCLYEAHHEVWPVVSARDPREMSEEERGAPADIVGPICETGDFLARDRRFPEVARGALIAVFSAGAYSFVMSSNYNSRPRAAEVLLEDGAPRLIRRRETIEDLLALERLD